MFEQKFPLLTLGSARRPRRWWRKGVRSREVAGGCSGRSPTNNLGPPTQVGGKAGRLIRLPRARPPRPRPAGAGRWQRLPPPPPGTQTARRKENDALTSGRVRKRESVPAPPAHSGAATPPPRTSHIPPRWATVSSRHRETDRRRIPARQTHHNNDLEYSGSIFPAPRTSGSLKPVTECVCKAQALHRPHPVLASYLAGLQVP